MPGGLKLALGGVSLELTLSNLGKEVFVEFSEAFSGHGGD